MGVYRVKTPAKLLILVNAILFIFCQKKETAKKKMRLLSLVAGVLLLITSLSLIVLESGVNNDKPTIHIQIISHLLLIIGPLLIGISRTIKSRK